MKFTITAPPWLDRIVTFDNLAQAAHLLAAMWVVEHLGRWTEHPAVFLGIVVALSAFKEAYVDLHWESAEVRGSGWKDFGFLAGGAVLGYLLAYH